MLFDLRSRGRRRTVQAVYLGLAVLMGGGLVLFGVGAGNGLGGLLNAFNGGGSNQAKVVSQQEKIALRDTRLRPNDPAAWAELVQARWTTATGADYNQSTQTFTAAGLKELTSVTQAWQRYLALTKTPDPNTAILAARAYGKLRDYAHEAAAWEIIAGANPTQTTALECLAVSAYAAKQTRKGDLAAAKALSLVPKLQRTVLRGQINQAKTQPQVAQQC
jgi:hypothetical protein